MADNDDMATEHPVPNERGETTREPDRRRERGHFRGFRRGFRGFTFFEIMVVLAIMVIITYLALPMIGAMTDDRLRSAAQMLEADLAAAQVGSITHADDPRQVVFDTDTNSYHIVAASNPDQPLTDSVTQQPYTMTFGIGRAAETAGVTIQSLELGGDATLGFGAYGQLDQPTPAVITLADGHRSITLTINPSTGQVTIGGVE